jgi:hypothetical protein
MTQLQDLVQPRMMRSSITENGKGPKGELRHNVIGLKSRERILALGKLPSAKLYFDDLSLTSEWENNLN